MRVLSKPFGPKREGFKPLATHGFEMKYPLPLAGWIFASARRSNPASKVMMRDSLATAVQPS